MNCSVCGDLIEGRYITLNDKNVCIRCSRLPVCSYCHLPIRNGKPVEIDLNHISCPKCFPNLVMKEEQLKALFKVSLILLAEMYTIKLKKLKKISFLDFSETIRATRHTLSGQGCSPLNVAGMANSDNEIIIQKGRPKGEVLGTITHELAHIWQFQEWGEVKLGEIEKYQLEGFCEWISYQLLI
ncbi:MAG: hypothetical protein KDK45_17955, partial [Leptospiraceae bacterium]|nr:hypothetical protein [Leptospiraceae bacterium]